MNIENFIFILGIILGPVAMLFVIIVGQLTPYMYKKMRQKELEHFVNGYAIEDKHGEHLSYEMVFDKSKRDEIFTLIETVLIQNKMEYEQNGSDYCCFYTKEIAIKLLIQCTDKDVNSFLLKFDFYIYHILGKVNLPSKKGIITKKLEKIFSSANYLESLFKKFEDKLEPLRVNQNR